MTPAMKRARNLAAFLPAAAAFACAHAAPSTARADVAAPVGQPPAEGRATELTLGDFKARLSTPAHPMPGAAAVLVLRGASGPASARAGDELAEAAVDAGIAALELESGSAGRALLWLGPRAKRIYVAAEGIAAATAAELVRSGHVAGLVLLDPPTNPAPTDIPCLVLEGGPAASKQNGRLWELTLPDLKSVASASPETTHTLVEATALWLTARAKEP